MESKKIHHVLTLLRSLTMAKTIKLQILEDNIQEITTYVQELEKKVQELKMIEEEVI